MRNFSILTSHCSLGTDALKPGNEKCRERLQGVISDFSGVRQVGPAGRAVHRSRWVLTEEVGLTQRCAVRRTGDRMHTRLQMQQEVSPAYRQRKLGTSPVDGIGAVWLDAGAVLVAVGR